jgi:hypothetical protein
MCDFEPATERAALCLEQGWWIVTVVSPLGLAREVFAMTKTAQIVAVFSTAGLSTQGLWEMRLIMNGFAVGGPCRSAASLRASQAQAFEAGIGVRAS